MFSHGNIYVIYALTKQILVRIFYVLGIIYGARILIVNKTDLKKKDSLALTGRNML
jgi:hypothetical protein